MSDEEIQSRTEWERRVRLFGLVVVATPPTLIGSGLLFTFVGDWARVGLIQRVAIGFALAVLLLAIAISRREPPEGRLLVAVRSAFFTTYAAVAVAAVLAVLDENGEILAIPIYLALIFSLHALYERCVQRFEAFGK
ncbi:hypothetical protein ACQP0C_32100 [Nocardia sp. CA-129566]|uniref:hypothetical protein n=1 Tax=Nocardia sp. CA-129566 TaxID=3239976 RepID=UPI003D9974CF